jgi:hypothetical protein
MTFSFGAILLAAALLIYLPLEPAVLSMAPNEIYWMLRLMPDAVIAIFATAAVAFDRTLSNQARVAMLALAGLVALAVAVNFTRGFDWTQTVNSLRVLLRYVPLGILLFVYTRQRDDVPKALVLATLVAVGTQVVGGLVDVATRPGFPPRDIVGALLIDGTVGRYDRFGLLLSIGALVVLGASIRANRRTRIALYGGLVAVLALLAASTSRQAFVALAVGTTPFLLLPRIPRATRATAAVMLALAMTFPFVIPTVTAHDVPASDDAPPPTAPATPNPPVTIRGGSNLSVDPNRNFRLFLALRFAPWAATQEPLVGFGPGQQIAADTDPRLKAYVEDAGTTWAWASRFTNDSNYASIVIQFGLVFAVAFVGFVVGLMLLTIRSAMSVRPPFAALSLSVALVVATAAFFGPAFEIRTTSIYLWCLLPSAAAMRRTGATQ